MDEAHVWMPVLPHVVMQARVEPSGVQMLPPTAPASTPTLACVAVTEVEPADDDLVVLPMLPPVPAAADTIVVEAPPVPIDPADRP